MNRNWRLFLLFAGLAFLILGIWGGLRQGKAYFFPPTPAPYALDQLSDAQLAGYTSAVTADMPEQPAFAPSLPTPKAPTPTRDPEPTTGETPEPTPVPVPPLNLSIPAIELDAPIVETSTRKFTINGAEYKQWIVPDEFAAGWNRESAMPGAGSNVVLFGHHTVNGSVFRHLDQLKEGDLIQVSNGSEVFEYQVSLVTRLKERGVSLAQMVENSAWILPSREERLTLVTCWPPYESTYRLVVVASPR